MYESLQDLDAEEIPFFTTMDDAVDWHRTQEARQMDAFEAAIDRLAAQEADMLLEPVPGKTELTKRQRSQDGLLDSITGQEGQDYTDSHKRQKTV